MNKFKLWMRDSTRAEKVSVATLADCSCQHMYDIASQRREASSALAGRIEAAIKAIGKKKRDPPLPVVLRGDISDACKNCSFYKQGCRK